MVHEKVTAKWRVIGESVQGASHASDGLPNQDAIYWTPPSGEGARLILAVSDGHGSAKHFRSDIGAALAVRVATREMQDLLQSQYDIASLSALRPIIARQLPRSLVRAWQTVVAAHVAESPFTDAEWERLVEKEGAQARQGVEAHPALAYAATLLSVVVLDSYILYVQLGDGDIVTVAETGEVSRPWGKDEQLLAKETTSLCLPNAWQECRVHLQRVSALDPALILLSTDGYAHSFSEEERFLKVGSDLLEIIRRHGLAWVHQKLAGWLADTSQHGARDDITLGIISRIDQMPPSMIEAAPQLEMSRQDVSGYSNDSMPVRPDDYAASNAACSAITSSSISQDAPPPPDTSRRQHTALQTRLWRLQSRHSRLQKAFLILGGMCAVTVFTLAIVLWRPRPAPPPLDNPQITLQEPTQVEPDEPQRPPRMFRLTVLPTPADSMVQITNIRPKYIPGMALEPGTYKIRVTREGFVPQERAITMSTADVTERIALKPLPPPPPRPFRLTVLPTPADSMITVTDSRNVSQKYAPGIALEPGTYKIRVTRDKHVAVEQTITISNADVVVPITLMSIPTPPSPRLDPVSPPQEPQQKQREAERARLEQEYNRLRQAHEHLAQRIARHNAAGRRLNEQGKVYILPEEVRRHNELVDRHQAESGRLLQEQSNISQQLDSYHRAVQRSQFSSPGQPEATQSLTESDGRPSQQEDGGRERKGHENR
jgi:hypothetical protein